MTDSEPPSRSADSAARRRYRRIVFLAVGLTLAYLCGSAWMTWVSYRDFEASLSPASRLAEASALIGELDEALTMSARLAAATGEEQWETRYRQTEPKLDAALQQVRREAPDLFAHEAARQTDAANRVLVALEYQALDLVHRGQRVEASALLASPAYEVAKQSYASGLQRLRSTLSARYDAHLAAQRRHVSASLIAAAVALPALVMIWVGALRAERRHAGARLDAERDLRASEARYRDLFQSNPHPMWVYDVETLQFLAVNEAAVAHYSYTEDEFLSMTIADIRPTEDVPRLQERVDHLAGQSGLGTSGTWLHRKRDGTIIDVEITSHNVNFLGRRARLVLANDVTDRKRAEAELRLQSAALNAAANAIVITDRDGAIRWINPAFTALTGYGADEALGRNPRDLVKSGVHDRAFYTRLWETILCGQVWCGEMTNRRKDGSQYVEKQSITPVKDVSGQITHFVAIKRDLTDEKQLQAQFLQAQKMETVGRLAGGIAHDFNNLLTVINGTADLASADLAKDHPLRADLQDIHEAGERAAALTRQLLAFSRKQIMNPIVLDLRSVMADMRSMLQRLIGEHIKLVVKSATGVGFVKADPGQIQQVVLNLAVNARDAMPDGGTLTIDTRDVEIDASNGAVYPLLRPGPHVMVTVSDTGAGMDAATRAHIFEPFFTTKPSGKGTGIGLATVYGIIKQSGGSVDVESEPGNGTTFTIYLPRVDNRISLEEPVSARALVTGTETILIVEDEEALAGVARRMLQSAGYQVLIAGNGEEALRVLAQCDGSVHLVLTDVVMPGISGPDLVARILVTHPKMKVLYTSGYTDDAILRHGVLDRVAHFVGKPYSVEELPRKVREVLDRHDTT
ncbi:MAG: PAS domain S-box protein [Acidobacteria bacterium]|nr:PAS domain S-box protein [Acidobacteriota bacterium]